MIGLSPLPAGHPEAFQRLSVRPSMPRYRHFSLPTGRSQSFASAPADCTPSSGSLSLRFRGSSPLTSPATATRRLIMQKARRHPQKGLRPLVGARFQVLFHSPARGPFHLSLTVLSAIGLSGVFSLAGWCRPIRAGFLLSRLTQGPAPLPSPFAYGPLTLSGAPFQALPLGSGRSPRGPSTPAGPRPRRFGLLRFRSPLLAESLLFSSPAAT